VAANGWDGEPLEVVVEPANVGASAWLRALGRWLLAISVFGSDAGPGKHLVSVRGANSYRTYWLLKLDGDEAVTYAADLRCRLSSLGAEGLLRDLGVN
jgi:hypothetical protein